MPVPSGSLKKEEAVGEGLSKGRWTVVRKIGEGGFAEVYAVKDTLQDVEHALKIERLGKNGSKAGLLKAEHRTLRRLQSVPFVCRLINGGWGHHAGRAYIVTELLGANIAQLQRLAPDHRWPLDVVCRTGIALLDGLQSIHEAGYIHRDVKPANFVLGARDQTAESGSWKAIDFGLARRYVAADGSVLPLRAEFREFRGSTTYASVNAHKKMDLGRRDDLWSWLYIMVEMLDGGLPWRADGRDVDTAERETAKEMAMELKQDCLRDPSLLTSNVDCPESFQRISEHLNSLDFEAQPDYGLLREALTRTASTALPLMAQQPATPLEPSQATLAAAPFAESGQGKHLPGEVAKRSRDADPRDDSSPDKRRRLGSPSQPDGTDPSEHQKPYDGRARAVAKEAAEVRSEPSSLSPAALEAAAAVGRLDPGEGAGVVAWIITELGSSRLAPAGRAAAACWLQEVSDLAAQTAKRMLSGKQTPSER